MRYKLLLALAVLAVTLGTVAAFLPPSPALDQGQPTPAAWEVQAWRETPCDRCGRGLTPDPGDGLYLVGGKPYWLHKACAQRLARVARR